MAKFIRKIASRTWLTDESLEDRLQRGVAKLRDDSGQPSVYEVTCARDTEVALAAIAARRQEVFKMSIQHADFVEISSDQIARAGLRTDSEPASIDWAELEGKHFVLTRKGEPCSDEDLQRLVDILIHDDARHGRVKKDRLREIVEMKKS